MLLSMILVSFKTEESRHYHGKCLRMLTEFINQNGEEDELYAEVEIPKKPVSGYYFLPISNENINAADFFKGNKFDKNAFYKFAYPILKSEILRQAKDKGIKDKIVFMNCLF